MRKVVLTCLFSLGLLCLLSLCDQVQAQAPAGPSITCGWWIEAVNMGDTKATVVPYGLYNYDPTKYKLIRIYYARVEQNKKKEWEAVGGHWTAIAAVPDPTNPTSGAGTYGSPNPTATPTNVIKYPMQAAAYTINVRVHMELGNLTTKKREEKYSDVQALTIPALPGMPPP